MDEKFKFNFGTNKIDIEKIAEDLAERNDARRRAIKVRDHLIDSTVELSEKEINIAFAIIEMGTDIVINNQ